MIPAPIPLNDAERLEALASYCVLDTPPEPAFDRLTRVAKHMFGVPTVLVSLIDRDRQWFKSRIGLDASETPRDISFCGHAVYHRKTLIVPDATKDPRFADNPLVAGPLGLRFYVGAPLINADGFGLGTLCVIDYQPHPEPSAEKIEALQLLANAVVDALELRLAAKNLTERQHALTLKREILQKTMDSISHGVSAFDENLKLIAWNKKFLELLEFPPELGRRGTDFAEFIACNARRGEYGPGDPDKQVAARVAMARQFMPHRMERVRPDGHIIEIRGEPMSIGGFVTTYTDVTDVRRKEADLRERLTERDRAERLKAEFVSTVSHELRTPLTSIVGALELLDAGIVGVLPPKAKDMVRIAHGNSQRLGRLVNDILDIEKMESGRMPFDIKPHRLQPLIERAIGEVAPFAAGFKVRLELDCTAADATGKVDPDRFMQVVTNLLSNAAKFSPHDAVVKVGLARTDHGLQVSVADCGPGIPEDFRARMFQKFAQADGSDSRRLAGTGLGLAIVKNIVERLGGTVSFETEIGRGTIFHVDLPEWRQGTEENAPAPIVPATCPKQTTGEG